ncbi:CHC2 zinc finger domain-containing protein [Amycolatopsis sp.]|uniref:CHC2 zinc finger domain-containing protein n=1 Tax=Amycolatopsis sp. TaxID=37632 RepID=UPI0039C8AE9E
MSGHWWRQLASHSGRPAAGTGRATAGHRRAVTPPRRARPAVAGVGVAADRERAFLTRPVGSARAHYRSRFGVRRSRRHHRGGRPACGAGPHAGDRLRGDCPFCGSAAPAFIVRPAHGTFHCLGCGAGGDAARFAAEFGR